MAVQEPCEINMSVNDLQTHKSWIGVVSNAFRFIRRLSGDDAYEVYLQHHKQEHPNQPLLNRRTFYLAQQQHKWSGIKRCC